MPPMMPILLQNIQKMLDHGGGKPSNSEHSSRIFLVPKREGEFRPIVNYFVLNQEIRVEYAPLPDTHSCFHWFRSAKVSVLLTLILRFIRLVGQNG
jgi:hypothetical protein